MQFPDEPILTTLVAQGAHGPVHRTVPSAGAEQRFLAERLPAETDLLDALRAASGALASLRHPFVMKSAVRTDATGAPVLVYPDLVGCHLEALLAGGALPVAVSCEIGRKLARALYAVWDRRPGPSDAPLRLVHGGLTPRHLWVGQDGQVQLQGLGQVPHRPVALRGPWTAPDATVSAAGDVYSLGLLLAYLVLGRPGAADRGGAAVGAEVTEASGVPALGSAVAACLALDPDGRPTAHAVEKQLEAVRRAHPEPRLSRWAGEQVPLLAQQAAARARAAAGAEPAAGAPVRAEDETVSGLDGAAFQRAFEATTADRDLTWDDPVLQQRLSAEEEDDPRTYDAVDPWEEDPSFGTDPLTEEAPRPAVRARPPAAEAPLTAESLAAAMDDEPLDGPAYALRSDPVPEAEASPEQQASQDAWRPVESVVAPGFVPMSRAPDLVDAIAYIAPGSDDEDVEEEATVEVDRQEAAVRFPGLYGSLDAGAAASAGPGGVTWDGEVPAARDAGSTGARAPAAVVAVPARRTPDAPPRPPRSSAAPVQAPAPAPSVTPAPPSSMPRFGRDRQEEEDSRKPLVLLLVGLAALALLAVGIASLSSRPGAPDAPSSASVVPEGAERSGAAADAPDPAAEAAAAAVAAVVPARDAADPPPGASGSPADEPAPAPAAPAPASAPAASGAQAPAPPAATPPPVAAPAVAAPSPEPAPRAARPRRARRPAPPAPAERPSASAVPAPAPAATGTAEPPKPSRAGDAEAPPPDPPAAEPVEPLERPVVIGATASSLFSRAPAAPAEEPAEAGEAGSAPLAAEAPTPAAAAEPSGTLAVRGNAHRVEILTEAGTPVEPGELPVGTYQIRVAFLPDDPQVSWGTARVSEGGTVTVACDANFLRCAVR